MEKEFSYEGMLITNVNKLLASGGNINTKDVFGHTVMSQLLEFPLIEAARKFIPHFDFNSKYTEPYGSEVYVVNPLFQTLYGVGEYGVLNEIIISNDSFKAAPQEVKESAFSGLIESAYNSRKVCLEDIVALNNFLRYHPVDLLKCSVSYLEDETIQDNIFLVLMEEGKTNLAYMLLVHGVVSPVKDSEYSFVHQLKNQQLKLVNETEAYDTYATFDKLITEATRIEALVNGNADADIYINDKYGYCFVKKYVAGDEDGFIFHTFNGGFHSYVSNSDMAKGYPKLGRVPAVMGLDKPFPVKDGDYVARPLEGGALVVSAADVAYSFGKVAR